MKKRHCALRAETGKRFRLLKQSVPPDAVEFPQGNRRNQRNLDGRSRGHRRQRNKSGPQRRFRSGQLFTLRRCRVGCRRLSGTRRRALAAAHALGRRPIAAVHRRLQRRTAASRLRNRRWFRAATLGWGDICRLEATTGLRGRSTTSWLTGASRPRLRRRNGHHQQGERA